MTEQKRILFLVGVARSGTTAMAELLNRHPDLCLGIERYKYKFMRRSDFQGIEFTEARFFDFRANDSNILPTTGPKWQTIYDRMATKFPQARVVGDKNPHLYEKFEACSQVFPEARWVYMLRDINGVASSWNARARNAKDKWPSQRDFRAAVAKWNTANRLVRSLPRDRVRIVGYEDFFGGDRAGRRALMDFIGLEITPGFARQGDRVCATYAEVISQKPPLVLEGQEEFIAANADMDSYQDLLARARDPQRSAAATA